MKQVYRHKDSDGNIWITPLERDILPSHFLFKKEKIIWYPLGKRDNVYLLRIM